MSNLNLLILEIRSISEKIDALSIKVDDLSIKVDKLSDSLHHVSEHTSKMSDHVDFVDKVYESVKTPFHRALSMISYRELPLSLENS